MIGNGVVGILAESVNIWERRAPLTPSHCARLLHGANGTAGLVERIIVQPSTKRIHHDEQYEDVGCHISEDLSACGLILGIKQPKLDMILPDRAYAFFSHTHKAQIENMALLDKILAERASLYDYELIVSDNGKRMLSFGKFAGRAGLIDFLHGLGRRYLNLGYSTPFLSLGESHMYSSLAAAKAAVIAVGEEIATSGLPSGICPIVFVFTGNGNVSQGAQEIFKLLPHTFVDPLKLPELVRLDCAPVQHSRLTRRIFQVYGCVITCQEMVTPRDSTKIFDKADYYAHPEHYYPVFHERIAPYASVIGRPLRVTHQYDLNAYSFTHEGKTILLHPKNDLKSEERKIVNCMYWEKRFPQLLTTSQLQELMKKRCPLVGISDITCDIGGSLEFVKCATSIDKPFFRYDPLSNLYHDDMEGDGVICSAVDILPTEFSKEASQHFGDILSQFISSLASSQNLTDLPSYLRRACIAHRGALTSLYEYIPRMRHSYAANSLPNPASGLSGRKKYTKLVSLSGHLFDQFLINEALDIIESAGGSFRLVKCDVGQSTTAVSYSELEVGADEIASLDQIIDSLTTVANPNGKDELFNKDREIPLIVGEVGENIMEAKGGCKKRPAILILGAGRVCRPAAEFLASLGNLSSGDSCSKFQSISSEFVEVQVVIASLYQKDAEEIIEGIPNAVAIQLDVTDYESLLSSVSQVEVVVSLLPPSFHAIIAKACIQHKRHLVTASYVDDSMLRLDESAKCEGVTILCEMGLDPGIDHMMAMKIINQAHVRKGKVTAFTSYCGGLPSPAAANNPLAYKFSWNPAGAIRAGQNPATYKSCGKIIHVDGDKLYNSAESFRLSDLPAFAFEYLPNRNSLIYGDLYGIAYEASTIFRATLRYEGFGEIMACLTKFGFFETKAHPMLKGDQRPTFGAFLKELLKAKTSGSMDDGNAAEPIGHEKEMVRRLILLGHCKEPTAVKMVKIIRFLGLHEEEEVPLACSSAFDVTCSRMEERLAYTSKEQDMVLLHHEVEVTFTDGRPKENHQATLLEFGRTENGQTTTAMALTVGIPAAIGALLLLLNKIQTRGVIRPLEPEVYVPALDILEASGIRLFEKIEIS